MRQWKKDIKSKYVALVNNNERLRKCLGDREEEIMRRMEDLKRNQQMENKRRLNNYVTDNSSTSESGGRKSS